MVLAVLFVAGLLIAFDRPLRAFLAPATGLAKAAGSTLQDRTSRGDAAAGGRVAVGPGPGGPGAAGAAALATAATAEAGRKARGAKVAAGESPGQTGVWGADGSEPPIPSGVPSGSPMSSTFAPARAAGAVGAATVVGTGRPPAERHIGNGAYAAERAAARSATPRT